MVIIQAALRIEHLQHAQNSLSCVTVAAHVAALHAEQQKIAKCGKPVRSRAKQSCILACLLQDGTAKHLH